MIEARLEGDAETEDKAIRWLSAGYDAVKEAKQDLGVSKFLGDDDLFDYLVLLAEITVLCGWRGLLVICDEASFISTHLDSRARKSNWAWVLTAYNSLHNGSAPHLGLMLAGTADLIDKEHGLLSNPSIESRLAPVGSGDGSTVFGPIIRLRRFSREELFVLLQRVRDLVFPLEERTRFPDDVIEALLNKIFSILGANQSLTTRDALKHFAVAAKPLIASPELDRTTLLSRDMTETETK